MHINDKYTFIQDCHKIRIFNIFSEVDICINSCILFLSKSKTLLYNCYFYVCNKLCTAVAVNYIFVK